MKFIWYNNLPSDTINSYHELKKAFQSQCIHNTDKEIAIFDMQSIKQRHEERFNKFFSRWNNTLSKKHEVSPMTKSTFTYSQAKGTQCAIGSMKFNLRMNFML